MNYLIALLHCIVFATASVYPSYHLESKVVQPAAWWQSGAFYQIYPRSFKDSNGDGVGDLNGITSRLSYLQELGITATWLSPIFTSPMADFGYDIANFTEIAPIFGTMADFDLLMATAKQLNIKIILDFVPNHTSDECDWFRLSAANDPEYKDFYVWHSGRQVNGTRHPPSNWVSVFHGSAWEWHEGRQQYYLHQFVKKQPDLNYRNPKVRETMKNVLRFWLDKGVSGFRIDAVPHLFEIAADSQGDFRDEPRNNNGDNDPDDYGYLQHIYTVDQPETLGVLYEWRAVLDDYQRQKGGDERILLAETYSPISIVMQYYGNQTMEGAQLPFNFLLISELTNSSNANVYAQTVNTWLTNMPQGRTANWVLGNHDKPRVGSRLGTDRVDMLNMLTMTLPGACITYQGEELGMADVWISWNDTVDPSACNTNPSVYERYTRDPERTPFQWSSDTDAGFSNASRTWLPIAQNYRQVNMEAERLQPLSHLNVFKQLLKMRVSEKTLQLGETQVQALSGAVLAVKRSLKDELTYITLLNIFDGVESINLQQHFKDLPEQLEIALVTDKSKSKVGELINTTSLQLLPKEALLLRSSGERHMVSALLVFYLFIAQVSFYLAYSSF